MDMSFAETMQAAGIDSELETFINRIVQDPEVLFMLTLDQRRDWESRMDAALERLAVALGQ